MKTIRLAIIGIFFLAIGFQSCKKDTGGTAPTLPPSTCFKMAFTDFDSSKTTSGHKGGLSTDTTFTYNNYLYSVVNVGVWNLVITWGLAVPVASYVEAFNHQATWDSKAKVWVWSYNFNWLGSYTAKLTGSVSGDMVHWEMFITKYGSYTDFLWYEGDSKIDGTQGTWTLYDNPNSRQQLLGILWHRNTSNNTADIKYTNIKAGDPENGGYISYGVTTDQVYNAYYLIYNKGKNNQTSIEWNSTSKNGHVADPLHYGDANFHAWNTKYQDISK